MSGWHSSRLQQDLLSDQNQSSSLSGIYDLQVKIVVATPEIAPAVPKQNVVEKFGYVPGVLTRARGESPVVLLITPSMAYLACW